MSKKKSGTPVGFFALVFILGIIAVFYAEIIFMLFAVAIFITLSIATSKSVKPALTRVGFLTAYFIPIALIQAFNYRGESILFLGLNLDLFGLKFTAAYFTRILALVFFLDTYLKEVRTYPIPNTRFGKELLRGVMFFHLTKKYFFRQFSEIRKHGFNFWRIPTYFALLISASYNGAFRHFPYPRLRPPR